MAKEKQIYRVWDAITASERIFSTKDAALDFIHSIVDEYAMLAFSGKGKLPHFEILVETTPFDDGKPWDSTQYSSYLKG